MGLSLILAFALNLENILWILEIAFALGMVIFVHELGHFAVAKWCGVKCEKFYLGFDIYGLKLFKYQWGETEYGIGILPLGGYVKMLGQDDNPGKAAAERERSQLASAEGQPVEAATEQLDPRSYLAKSVPQRMAIISAGVVMNVIFAFVCATIAYAMGVEEIACNVSATLPGEPAWRANLQPGDQIVGIDGHESNLRFRDLMAAVAFGDMTNGIDFKIKRAGVSEPFTVNLKPEAAKHRLLPSVGVKPQWITRLPENPVVRGGSPAAAAGKFEAGDEIVAIDGQPVKSYADYQSQLVGRAAKPLEFTVVRHPASENKEAPAKEVAPQEVKFEVPPQPIRDLGLVMTMAPITSIQHSSPAEEAGLRAGDVIQSIDGQPVGDPLRLADMLAARAGETVSLTIERTEGGKKESLTKEVKLRERRWAEESAAPGASVSVPSLGIAFKVQSVVAQVTPGGPAATAELSSKDGKKLEGKYLAPGDEIVSARITLPTPTEEELAERKEKPAEGWARAPDDAFEFSADKPNWPYFMFWLQQLPPGEKAVLTLSDGRTVTLEPAASGDWFYSDRGLLLGADEITIKANSFGEAVSLGGRETIDALSMVYKFLRRLGSQVSPKALGGPLTIAQSAGAAASQGVSTLLLFLTMLSANLAVINFLPIPLLDGGHMVFLALEGILRRPVSEKVVVAFHYAGFVFIISLMLFVLGLDISRL